MRSALALVLCLFVLSACATPGGIKVEGEAAQVTPPPTTPPLPSDVTPSADPVALLRADTKVSDKIKALLTPCVQGRYPVDARYDDVTKDGVADLLITVTTCDSKQIIDAYPDLSLYARLGGTVANYVFDLKPKPPVNVFTNEDPGTAMDQRNGMLQLVHWEYRAGDRSCCPSGTVAKVYQWTGTTFELFRK